MIGKVLAATFTSSTRFTVPFLSLGFDPSQYLSPSINCKANLGGTPIMTNCVIWQFHEKSVDALLHAREVINITECCNRFFKLVTTL